MISTKITKIPRIFLTLPHITANWTQVEVHPLIHLSPLSWLYINSHFIHAYSQSQPAHQGVLNAILCFSESLCFHVGDAGFGVIYLSFFLRWPCSPGIWILPVNHVIPLLHSQHADFLIMFCLTSLWTDRVMMGQSRHCILLGIISEWNTRNIHNCTCRVKF